MYFQNLSCYTFDFSGILSESITAFLIQFLHNMPRSVNLVKYVGFFLPIVTEIVILLILPPVVEQNAKHAEKIFTG